MLRVGLAATSNPQAGQYDSISLGAKALGIRSHGERNLTITQMRL